MRGLKVLTTRVRRVIAASVLATLLIAGLTAGCLSFLSRSSASQQETAGARTVASEYAQADMGAATDTTRVVPSETPLPTSTPTPSPTDSPTATATASRTLNPTATQTLTLTITVAATPTADTSAIAGTMPTPDGITRTLSVPILMYHYVSTPPDDADAIRTDLSVPPELFRAQIGALATAGYQTISLGQLMLALEIGAELPERPVVLTFDDGYVDNYTNALPILLDHGAVGTFFLITGYIDDEQPAYVTWDQVIEMDRLGMAIEAHCHTHVDLSGRDVDYLVWQMVGSREAIEARTNKPVRFFSYPSGRYDELAIQVLHSANFWGAVTVNDGAEQRSDAPFELTRIRVHGDTSPDSLLEAIEQAVTAPPAGDD